MSSRVTLPAGILLPMFYRPGWTVCPVACPDTVTSCGPNVMAVTVPPFYSWLSASPHHSCRGSCVPLILLFLMFARAIRLSDLSPGRLLNLGCGRGAA